MFTKCINKFVESCTGAYTGTLELLNLHNNVAIFHKARIWNRIKSAMSQCGSMLWKKIKDQIKVEKLIAPYTSLMWRILSVVLPVFPEMLRRQHHA
jgi:hypothetical protein